MVALLPCQKRDGEVGNPSNPRLDDRNDTDDRCDRNLRWGQGRFDSLRDHGNNGEGLFQTELSAEKQGTRDFRFTLNQVFERVESRERPSNLENLEFVRDHNILLSLENAH